MRLERVNRGHAPPAKALLALFGKISGGDMPDVVKTLWYRAKFFGQLWSVLTQRVMRGESEWSVGERELFATFTASLNQCVF